ncbi:MAG TPA: VWA domain-containing protein [Candidatus Limnocylindrales bacterium]|nr:VWA domain-containing protein [Candidatus Limnocylindrales bacterium]
MRRKFLIAGSLLLLLVLAACDGGAQTVQTGQRPNNAVDVSIIYAPESEQYMPQVIADFNRASSEGRNPVTGQPWAQGESPIWVTGQSGSSGTVMQGIVNALIAPNNQNVARPTIFQPSVSHWLALANYQSGRSLFDLADARATALAPVVMAIWESRLNAIRETVGYEDVGWEELLGVLNSENGWQDYGIPNGRRTVYYGHTDPNVSSTGLSTLIGEFYASAREIGFTGRRLTADQVRDPAVQQGVRDIEALIRHYSTRTTEFKEYIAQGPEYLDFVALEENDLIYINRGLTEYRPPERLVALYPKEGTFWHEHPMGIVNADWVTPAQAQAARVFVDYVLTEPVQQAIMAQGFRPANPDVELGFPFVEENGVDPAQPRTILDVPAPDVIAAIQQSWAFVKKQADIVLLIDTSGSMASEDKIAQAISAAEAFLNATESNNRIGLTTFSDVVEERVPLGNAEGVYDQVYSNIRSLRADGGTELFMAIRDVVTEMNKTADDGRIRAVVVLSDGADTGDQNVTLQDAVRAIESSRDSLNPIIVIPVAYGSDADINALNAIARASNTRVQSGDPDSILRVLQIISSYF